MGRRPGTALTAGLVTATLLHPRVGLQRLTPLVAGLALVSALGSPGVFVAETMRLPHVGSGPMAGPGRGATSTALYGGATVPLLGVSGYRRLTPGVVTALSADAQHFTWGAAAMGARSAAAYQLASDVPVLAIGGYKGTDPLPTLERFQALVSAGEIHWLVPGGTTGTTGRQIQAWVAPRFASVVVDGQELYDLSQRLA